MIPERSCVFGSETGEAFASRRCESINQWANGINPGECFSQVTMQIQSIGVSSFQSASTLAYNDALSCSITFFSKMTTNTYIHTYMTS